MRQALTARNNISTGRQQKDSKQHATRSRRGAWEKRHAILMMQMGLQYMPNVSIGGYPHASKEEKEQMDRMPLVCRVSRRVPPLDGPVPPPSRGPPRQPASGIACNNDDAAPQEKTQAVRVNSEHSVSHPDIIILRVPKPIACSTIDHPDATITPIVCSTQAFQEAHGWYKKR